MRAPIILLLGALALVALLAVVGVLPLGLFDAGEGSTSADIEDGLGISDESEAGLEGRAASARETDGDAAALRAEPDIPAEVRGTTRNGASIRGRVVIEKGRAPASGVLVRLVRPDSIFHYLRAEARGRFDLLEAKTGADGHFAFLDVTPADQYVVRAHQDPHARASSDALDLRGGEHVDLGDIELGPGGGLEGRVLHADGRPAVGARVAITWRVMNSLGVVLTDPDAQPELERETTTDESGRFEVQALEPGIKTVIVVAQNSASDVTRSEAIVAGAVSTLDDITLPGDAAIAGFVRWGDDTPVEGARVFAGLDQKSPMRTVETKADGSFRLGWLPAGAHYVGVLVSDMPIQIAEGIETGTEDFLASFPVPGSVKGKLVQEESTEPVTTFTIAVQRTDITDYQARFIQGMVLKAIGPRPFDAPDGTFVLPRLSPGEYMFEVEAPGFPKVRQTGISVVGGEATEGVVIEMPRGRIVRGRVKRAGGSGLADARLYVLTQAVAQRGPDLEDFLDAREPAATSRGDGSFELPPQAPSKIHIAVVHDAAVATISPEVDVRKGDVSDLEIVMPAAGTIEGLLLGEGGRPAETDEEFYVVYPDGEHFRDGVDEDGRFRLSGVPVGECVVRWLSIRDIRKFAKVVQSRDLEARRAAYDEIREMGGEHFIRDGETLTVTLEMSRRVQFSGDLRVDGVLAANAGIWVTLPEGEWGDWVPTDDAGHFSRELESGKYHVWIPDAEGDWTRDDLEIPDQREFAKDFER